MCNLYSDDGLESQLTMNIINKCIKQNRDRERERERERERLTLRINN